MQQSKVRPSFFASALADEGARNVAYQVFAAVAIGTALFFFTANTVENLTRLGIASGFGFLGGMAGYDVSEGFIAHSSRSTVGWIFLVGLLNTLYISSIGIVLATILGVLIGIARVSPNWIMAKLSAAYIELFRNTPMLLQIAFWYALVRQLPLPRQAFNPTPGIFLSNRGLVHPLPVFDSSHGWMLGSCALAFIAFLAFWRWAARRRTASGKRMSLLGPAGLAILIPIATGWYTGSGQVGWNIPTLRGFNFQGGTTHSPEFVALLTGLVTYIAAFIGEIVRAGIQAVSIGQREAARSLGIREGDILRYVTLPQALRVIVPPLTSQYLNLVKDSSLAVWIGYPDLVSVANTAINQTGQALENIFIMMVVYLSVSLSISAFMNWYNRKVALKGTR